MDVIRKLSSILLKKAKVTTCLQLSNEQLEKSLKISEIWMTQTSTLAKLKKWTTFEIGKATWKLLSISLKKSWSHNLPSAIKWATLKSLKNMDDADKYICQTQMNKFWDRHFGYNHERHAITTKEYLFTESTMTIPTHHIIWWLFLHISIIHIEKQFA